MYPNPYINIPVICIVLYSHRMVYSLSKAQLAEKGRVLLTKWDPQSQLGPWRLIEPHKLHELRMKHQ